MSNDLTPGQSRLSIPPNSPIVDSKGEVTMPWRIWFTETYTRQGGNVATTNSDLQTQIDGIDVSSINSRLDGIDTEISTINGEITSINSEITSLQGDNTKFAFTSFISLLGLWDDT